MTQPLTGLDFEYFRYNLDICDMFVITPDLLRLHVVSFDYFEFTAESESVLQNYWCGGDLDWNPRENNVA
jgi:hypothetical protein